MKKNVLLFFPILILLIVLVNRSISNASTLEIGNPRISADGTVTWDKIQFGSYDQNRSSNKQPIKWRILSISENGEDAFLLADKALDRKPYNEIYEDVTWETCSLRKWLNGEFYETAFTDTEKAAINETVVKNNNNIDYNTVGGNDTVDNVFLLSIDEVLNASYGFDDYNLDFINDRKCKSRQAKATDYAIVNNAVVDKQGNCYWWLRSPGEKQTNAVSIIEEGWGIWDGTYVDMPVRAVRPAIHVNLKSLLVKDAGEIDSEGNVSYRMDGYNNPQKEDGITTWDCVYFGNYYQDLFYERGPIEWRVLSVNGDDVFLLSDKIVDYKPYNQSDGSCTWENSTLRTWLNGDFYNSAFTDTEKRAIIDTQLADNVNDKIYLLLPEELSNSAYGFTDAFTERSKARQAEMTDYSHDSAALLDRNSAWNSDWWTRATVDSYYGVCVDYYGAHSIDYGDTICEACAGVRPALHVNLSILNYDEPEKITDNSHTEGDASNVSSEKESIINDNKEENNNKKVITKGQIIECNSAFYKIGENSSVTYIMPKKKSAQSISIPDSIKIDGTKYNVTAISDNAFKNNKKLKKVTIGKNVTKIGKNAFFGCKKLSKITIKSTKLKSIGKNALKGINKKATIKVPKKQLKKYKKLFKSKTGYKKTMKIKK